MYFLCTRVSTQHNYTSLVIIEEDHNSSYIDNDENLKIVYKLINQFLH